MSFLNLHQPENDHTSSSPSSSSLFLSSLHNAEQHVFSCSYCSRKFYIPQAFGGHQNAHKLERTLAKKNHELSSAARHKSDLKLVSFVFVSDGSTNVRQLQQPVVIGIQHDQQQAGSLEMEINVDYGYKGEGLEEDMNHLDLSLRL